MFSNKEENLIRLQDELSVLFDVESRVGERKNGVGARYYELSVNKKDEVRKLVKYDMINTGDVKWLNLKRLMT